jgi:hypothetical protein
MFLDSFQICLQTKSLLYPLTVSSNFHSGMTKLVSQKELCFLFSFNTSVKMVTLLMIYLTKMRGKITVWLLKFKKEKKLKLFLANWMDALELLLKWKIVQLS